MFKSRSDCSRSPGWPGEHRGVPPGLPVAGGKGPADWNQKCLETKRMMELYSGWLPMNQMLLSSYYQVLASESVGTRIIGSDAASAPARLAFDSLEFTCRVPPGFPRGARFRTCFGLPARKVPVKILILRM